MKYLILSDIHGALDSCLFLEEEFKKGSYDQILLLGDVLYHGPRNDLPPTYNPKKCIEIMNSLKDKILCIKGNCEAEVDEMVLDFPILDSYTAILNGISTHLEHGHHLDLYTGDAKLVLYGHTHIPDNSLDPKGYHKINPGSISIPKANSKRGFAVWEDKTITLYTIDKEIVSTYTYE